jgi:uncharacterized integral membrane protein
MTATTHRLTSDAGSTRFARLSAAAAALRTRALGGRKDQWLLIVGGILMPLGILLIILGWLGASHTPLPFEQNSYLISGGILGLALVIAGGFIYFAYWQSTRIHESRQQARDLTAAIGRLETLLGSGVAEAVSGGRTTATATFVATPNGSIFHRPDCTVVVGRTDLSSVDPDKTKLEPCRICTPLDTTSR